MRLRYWWGTVVAGVALAIWLASGHPVLLGALIGFPAGFVVALLWMAVELAVDPRPWAEFR